MTTLTLTPFLMSDAVYWPASITVISCPRLIWTFLNSLVWTWDLMLGKVYVKPCLRIISHVCSCVKALPFTQPGATSCSNPVKQWAHFSELNPIATTVLLIANNDISLTFYDVPSWDSAYSSSCFMRERSFGLSQRQNRCFCRCMIKYDLTPLFLYILLFLLLLLHTWTR